MMRVSIGIGIIASTLLAGPVGSEEVPGIRVVYVPDGVPFLPDAREWQAALVHKVSLSPQIILPPNGGGSIQSVSVRALHDTHYLALRLEWADATANQEVGVNRFRDAIAVGFPTRQSERLPSPFMGDAEAPINIWQWTADFDANTRGYDGFADNYPHTEGVWYFPQDYEVAREVRAWRGTEPVIELVASGWGTLERKVTQNILGVSKYRDGHWYVVLRRQLATGNPEDTLFRPGETTQMIIAVWDGEHEDVNGKKSITMMWTPLILDATTVAER